MDYFIINSGDVWNVIQDGTEKIKEDISMHEIAMLVDELVDELVDKFKAIEENFDVVKKVAQTNAESDETVDEKGTPRKPKLLEEVKELTNATSIEVVLDIANDEFAFRDSKDYLPNSVFCIEVVTNEVAVENDMDFLEDDEVKKYKLFNEYSMYSKLNENYAFRFM